MTGLSSKVASRYILHRRRRRLFRTDGSGCRMDAVLRQAGASGHLERRPGEAVEACQRMGPRTEPESFDIDRRTCEYFDVGDGGSSRKGGPCAFVLKDSRDGRGNAVTCQS